MSFTPIPSIRSRLVVLVLACILPSAIMVGGLIFHDYQSDRERIIANVITTARMMILAVDQRLLVTRSGLSALAVSPSLRTRNLASFYEEATASLPELNAESVALLGADGEMILNTLKPFGAPMPANHASQLAQVLQSGQPVFADLFTGSVAGNRRVAVGVPVIHDGKVAYSINASITPDRLQTILLQQRLPAEWVAAIIDNAGTIVARSRDQERFVGVKVSAAGVERLNGQRESAVEVKSLEGIPALSAFSRSGMSGWAVALIVPSSQLTGELARSALWLGMATLLLLGFTFALASSLGNNIIRTIRDLIEPAVALGGGAPLAAPPPLPLPLPRKPAFREAAQLGHALHQAAVLLGAANNALTHSEGRLSTILESAMDAVIVLDEDHRVLMFNAAAERLFGCSRQEALGTSVAQFLPHRRDDPATPIDFVDRRGDATAQTGSAEPLVGLRRGGEEFPIDAAISQFEENGRRIYTLLVRDVTERVRAHDELLRSNLDLQQFAFVASHDLRTPLRSVMGYLQLLKMRHGQGLDPKALDLIHRASLAVQTLDHLTDDLLTYARVDGQVKPFTAIDCNEVLADTLKLMDAAIVESAAGISAGRLPVVLGDRAQLVQLFQNLLANSITYREARPPQIRVSSEPGPDAMWTISVADDGIGIEIVHHERIFEIFKRLHTTQEFPGTGIGLALCRRIVERHGGRIWVTSAARQGSTFSFTIPMIPGGHR